LITNAQRSRHRPRDLSTKTGRYRGLRPPLLARQGDRKRSSAGWLDLCNERNSTGAPRAEFLSEPDLRSATAPNCDVHGGNPQWFTSTLAVCFAPKAGIG
jgi:hypothetical protein